MPDIAAPQGAAGERGHYSVTGLMVYEACPYQYYATFVEGKPPPVTPAMRRGANVHSLIAKHLRQPALLNLTAETDVNRLFHTFLNSRFNIPPVEVERSFVLPFDRGDIHGRTDLVLPGQNGGLELVDFKSGRTRFREELAQSLQLPTYAMDVARRHDLPAERLSYTYFFLGDAGEVSFTPTDVTFLTLTERVERVMHAIEEGRFEPRPGCRCYACRGQFGRSARRSRRTGPDRIR